MNQITNEIEMIRATMRAEFAAARATFATTKPATAATAPETHVNGDRMTSFEATLDRMLFVVETVVDRYVVTPMMGPAPTPMAAITAAYNHFNS